MAYSRSRRSGSFRRRVRRGARRFRRKFRRGGRRYMRRSMTRRRVVDISSRKCHDNMISLGVDAAGNPLTEPGAPYNMTGEKLWAFCFAPSARSSEWTEASGEYQRHMTRTWSRGYKEFSTFETGGAANWQWRRIVFTTKFKLYQAFPLGTVEKYYDGSVPINGQTRAIFDFTQSSAANIQTFYILFEGSRGVDYSDVFSAKTNKKFVRVISDKVRQLKGGNDAAHFHNYRDWFSNNSTLVYNEKESGDRKPDSNAAKFSTGGREGEGDMYVVDLFACANGGTANQARWVPSGKYYWHER
ncbi:MAG: capsid protein [Genomoviridae sp.]|uniref:capsid protein n=1 Tax=Genomoviridae sp. TaxID=2202565 RepID=UPI002481C56E|nr:MAG: capsid protein [Genomoviridae sp.]QCW23622.1 MAG: capsid protein [Genomoviridae sp.]